MWCWTKQTNKQQQLKKNYTCVQTSSYDISCLVIENIFSVKIQMIYIFKGIRWNFFDYLSNLNIFVIPNSKCSSIFWAIFDTIPLHQKVAMFLKMIFKGIYLNIGFQYRCDHWEYYRQEQNFVFYNHTYHHWNLTTLNYI